MERVYEQLIQEHLAKYRQMIFLSGPRQAGKTTLSKACAKIYHLLYLNCDNLVDRELILSGIEKIYQQFSRELVRAQ